jgi:Ca2+-binding EF-hand superfamily protein
MKELLGHLFENEVEFETFRNKILRTDEDLCELIGAIRRICKISKINSAAVLKKFDKDNTGTLSIKEFRNFIESLGIRLTFEESELIFDQLDDERDMTISEEELSDILTDNGRLKGGDRLTSMRQFKEKVTSCD